MTIEQLTRVFRGEPYSSEYSDQDVNDARLKTLVTEAQGLPGLGYEFSSTHGNFVELFFYRSEEVPDFALSRQVSGLLVLVMEAGPFCAMTRIQKCIGGVHEAVDLASLLTDHRELTPWESQVISILEKHQYQLLSSDEAQQPLPAFFESLKNDFYCTSKNSEGTVYSLLFGEAL